MKNQSIQENALHAIQVEADAIAGLKPFINDDFIKAVETIAASKGRLIVSGIGKSAIIAQKIVATLNSTGTPAIYMHAADGLHGDLGMVLKDDLALIISKSGESSEIKNLLPMIRTLCATVIGLCGNSASFLAKQSDIFLNCTVQKEACPNNLAPTSSTTAQLVMGDALAVALMHEKGFNSDDFARFHPGGALGKKLYLRVKDLHIHNGKPSVTAEASLKKVIMEITSKRLGATAVVDENDQLLGIITDGDLRRMLEKNSVLENISAKDIMSMHPKTIEASALAIHALEMLRSKDINQLIVTQENKYAGFIHLHDLIREGIL